MSRWLKVVKRYRKAIVPKEYKLGTLSDELIDCVRVKIEQQDRYLQEITQGKHIINEKQYDMLRISPEQLKTYQLFYDKFSQSLLDHTGKTATTIGKKK